MQRKTTTVGSQAEVSESSLQARQVELLGEGNLQSQIGHLCEHQKLHKGSSALGELSEQRKEGVQGLQGQTRSKRFEVTMH